MHRPPAIVAAIAMASELRRIAKKAVAKTVEVQGIKVHVDRPAGFVQRGTDDAGMPWERTYKRDYGYIAGTLGGDGEGLDVFVGDDLAAKRAYWAVQRKADGSFDEYKLLLGFPSLEAAKACYVEHIPERFLASMGDSSVEQVKALLGIEPVEDLDGMQFGPPSAASYRAKSLTLALRAAILEAGTEKAQVSGMADHLAKAMSNIVHDAWGAMHGLATSVEDLDLAKRGLAALAKACCPACAAAAEDDEARKGFAGFADFAACQAAQHDAGHDGESADRICGYLQAKDPGHAAKAAPGAAAQDLVAFGPPDEWSGAVAAAAGEARRAAMKTAWDGMDEAQRAAIRRDWEAAMSKSSPARRLSAAAEIAFERKLGKAFASPTAKAEMRFALAPVLEPETTDGQGDIYDAPEIEAAAHRFMADFRNIGLMHKGIINDRVKLVESYIAPVDFEINGQAVKAGTWLMGLRFLDDELWQAAKDGELTGLSIGGFATKTPIP